MAATASASPQGMLCALLMLSHITPSFLDPSAALESNRQVTQARRRQLHETSRDAEAAASPTRLNIWPSDFEDNTKFHHLFNKSSYDSNFLRLITENIYSNTSDLSSGDSFGFHEGKLKRGIHNENEKDVKSSVVQYYYYSENGRSVYDIHHHFNKFNRKTSPKDLEANYYFVQKKRPIGKFNESWYSVLEPLYSRKYTSSWFDIKKELKEAGLFSEPFKGNAYNENGWTRNTLKSFVNPRIRRSSHFSSTHRECGKESCQLPGIGRKVHKRHPRTTAWVSRLRRRSLDPPHDGSVRWDPYSPPFSEYQSMRRHDDFRVLHTPPSYDDCLPNEPSYSTNAQTPARVCPRPEPAVASHFRDAHIQNTTTRLANRHQLLAPTEDWRFLYGEDMSEFSWRERPFSAPASYFHFYFEESRNLVFHNHRLVSCAREYPFLPFGIEFDVPGNTNPLYSKYREGAFQESFPTSTVNFISSKDSSAKAKRRNAINVARTEYGFYRSIPIEEFYDKRWPKNPHFREDCTFQTKKLCGNPELELSSSEGTRESDGPQLLRKEKVYVPESSFPVYTKPMRKEGEGESEREIEYFSCVQISKPDDVTSELLCERVKQPVSIQQSCPFLSGGRRPDGFGDARAEKWRQEILERTKKDYAFYDKLDFSKYIDERYPRNPNFQFNLPVFDKYQTKEAHQLEYEERMEKAKTRDYVKEGNDPVEYPLRDAMREQGGTDHKEFPCPRAAIRENNNRASFTNSPLLSGHLPSGFSSKGISGISSSPVGIRGDVREASDSRFINSHQRGSGGGEGTISKEKVKNRFEFLPALPGHPLLKPLPTLWPEEDPKDTTSDVLICPPMKLNCVFVDEMSGEEWENDELIKFLVSDYYFEDRGERGVGDAYFKKEFDNMKGIYTKSRESFRTDWRIESNTSGEPQAKHFWMFTEDGKKYICTRKTKPLSFS